MVVPQTIAGKGETTMTDTIDTESNSKPQPESAKPKGGRKLAKKTKTVKQAAPPKKAARKPKADSSNKKAEVIAMDATGWQRHTVRGFVSILGSKGGGKIESSKNAAGERTYKITK
jgi:Protein of unknown function (DUF3489)